MHNYDVDNNSLGAIKKKFVELAGKELSEEKQGLLTEAILRCSTCLNFVDYGDMPNSTTAKREVKQLAKACEKLATLLTNPTYGQCYALNSVRDEFLLETGHDIQEIAGWRPMHGNRCESAL